MKLIWILCAGAVLVAIISVGVAIGKKHMIASSKTLQFNHTIVSVQHEIVNTSK